MLKLERLIASGTALASLAVCVFSYASILRSEQSSNAELVSVAAGSNKYAIKASSGCVGIIQTELVKENGYTVRVKGALRIKIKDALQRLTLNATGEFNSFGQLGASQIRFDFADLFLTIQTHELDPIEVAIATNIVGPKIPQSRSIKGPVIIKESATHRFSIQYPGFEKRQEALVAAFTIPALGEVKKFGTELVAFENMPQASSCEADGTDAIDISPLVEKALAFVGQNTPATTNEAPSTNLPSGSSK